MQNLKDIQAGGSGHHMPGLNTAPRPEYESTIRMFKDIREQQEAERIKQAKKNGWFSGFFVGSGTGSLTNGL